MTTCANTKQEWRGTAKAVFFCYYRQKARPVNEFSSIRFQFGTICGPFSSFVTVGFG